MREESVYHLPRPRLTSALTPARTGLVVGGGGYGKTWLAAEMSDVLGVPAVTATIDQASVSAELLLVRLRAGAARLGLSDVTAYMDRAGHDDPNARVSHLLEALDGQPVLLVVDEVHNAAPDAVGLLVWTASQLGDDQRLLLVGRHAPAGLDALSQAPTTVTLGTRDLALTEAELGDLCGEGFGLTLSPEQLADVRTSTEGWLAAVVLLAAQLKADSAGPRRTRRQDRGGQEILATLVDDILGRLSQAEQTGLLQAAQFPLLDDELLAAATGIEGLLAKARSAGLPLSDGPAPWCQLIGPVRDLLMHKMAARPEVLVGGAQCYSDRGEPALGADVLIAAGQPDDAAQLLASLTAQQAERVDLAEFASLTERLPESAVARYPRLLLNLAHQCAPAAMTRLRAATLERATSLVDPAIDAALSREIGAEVARDLVWEDRQQEAEELATKLLGQTGAGEELTRARLLEVLGRAASFQKDDVHLRYAEERLQIAARTYRAHEQWTWLSTLMTPLAIWVQVPRGAYDEAVRCLDEALALVPHHRLNRGVILTFRAEILAAVGRYEEAADTLTEAEDVATASLDPRLRAYIEWDRARAASQQGDAAATEAAIAAVEAVGGEWFDQSGCLFLADAAEFLDRVGLFSKADDYLARAKSHRFRDEPALGRVDAELLARRGDPQEAEQRLLTWLAAPWFEPRDEWRVSLLRAYVAARRGDADAAGLAGTAFALAARLGYPQLPLIQDRAIAEELLALAGDNEQLTTLNLDSAAFPVVISLLGRFQVTQAGRVLDVPPGQGRQLLKLIASAGGSLSADQVIEQLWPDVDYEVGANRLRTVLNRLRESVGDVALRDDRVLRLAPHVHTDAHRFEEGARRAMSLASARSPQALAVARSALAAYRGDLLPDDPYEPWATMPRERLRRHALSLLNLCAEVVAAVGDLDEAVRCLVRATDLAPYEEERYLTIARHLLTQGRRGAARSYVERAHEVLKELNLSPPVELLDLDRLVRAM